VLPVFELCQQPPFKVAAVVEESKLCASRDGFPRTVFRVGEREILHVTNRGNDRQPIFVDDLDYATFLRLLEAAFDGIDHERHAYCLILNHYHLLIEATRKELSRAMHRLNGRYARRFNQRYARTGHVFQGPYTATAVARDEHFLEALRYIVLNPVRAGLCEHPATWPWSSYRDEQTPLVRAMLGERAAFERFVLAGSERLQPA
jgi:REP element-mobilizing transposase RayT